MSFKITVEPNHQAVAGDLLSTAGFTLLRIAGDEVWLKGGTKAAAEAALTDLPTIAAEEQLLQAKTDAATRIVQLADATVDAAASNPAKREIASWSVKIPVAEKVIAGEITEAPILIPTQIKHDLSVLKAAELVKLKARLYELTNTAADLMRDNVLRDVHAATEASDIKLLEEAFISDVEARIAQLAGVRSAAEGGDLAPLIAAEAEIAAALNV